MSNSEPFDPSRLPRLKETIRAHGLAADKRLGQHFLIDPAILRAIASSAGGIEGRQVVEVGPGPGGLTRALLEAGAEVTAIERDPRCVHALRGLEQVARGRLHLIEGDALKLDTDDLIQADPYLVIANLPYNIATELLVRWLRRSVRIVELRVMMQREVVDRLVAEPRSSAYGRLSVLAQSLSTVRRLMELPAGAFHPPPKVRSSLVALTPLAQRPEERVIRAQEQITAAAFQQRRKMLRSSLRGLGVSINDLLGPLHIAPTARAQELSVDDYSRLAGRLLEIRRAAS